MPPGKKREKILVFGKGFGLDTIINVKKQE